MGGGGGLNRALTVFCQRLHGGVVERPVYKLDFRSEDWRCEPGLSLDKKLYSTFSLFTQVYKRVPAIIKLGVAVPRPSIPGGSSNIPRCFMLRKPEF